MHQKRTNKLFLFDYMTNGFHHKKSNVICTSLPCNVSILEKDTIIVNFDYMRNGSASQKEQFLLFVLFSWTSNASRKGQVNCFLLTTFEEWLSSQKEQFLVPFWTSCFLEKNVICNFCLAKCIRKGQKISFLLTTWRMALTTKRAIFCSFLNVIFLEKNVICTFCVIFLICTFFLAKCIRKGQQNCSFWLHERTKIFFLLTTRRMALTTKRAIVWFLSERHLSRKERHL